MPTESTRSRSKGNLDRGSPRAAGREGWRLFCWSPKEILRGIAADPTISLMHLREEDLEQYALGTLPLMALRDFELHVLVCHPSGQAGGNGRVRGFDACGVRSCRSALYAAWIEGPRLHDAGLPKPGRERVFSSSCCWQGAGGCRTRDVGCMEGRATTRRYGRPASLKCLLAERVVVRGDNQQRRDIRRGIVWTASGA